MAKTILVIDDDQGLIKILEKGLTIQGFHVISAQTGEEGLRKAEENNVDLILLDVILPSMKGRQVCAHLKANERTKHIPVVFLTAKNSPDDLKAEMDAGAIAHITKPLDMNILVPQVLTILKDTTTLP